MTVINNRPTMPKYFVKSLLELYIYTKKHLDVDLKFMQANSVNHMRNLSVKLAIDGNFDYLVMLDDDHLYDKEFIVKFFQIGKDIITGCTNQRTFPYFPTQYYKIQKEMKTQKNLCYFGEDKLEVIEASGPVGMLIKVDILKKMKWPYYFIDWKEPERVVGGDMNFCKTLKKLGVPIYCDLSTNFPHEVNGFTFGKTLDFGKLRVDFEYPNEK